MGSSHVLLQVSRVPQLYSRFAGSFVPPGLIFHRHPLFQKENQGTCLAHRMSPHVQCGLPHPYRAWHVPKQSMQMVQLKGERRWGRGREGGEGQAHTYQSAPANHLPRPPLTSLSPLRFFYSFLWRAVPMACGSPQARGQIGAAAASLHHSHSHARSLTH